MPRPQGLLLPDGSIHSTREKDVQPLNRMELQTLARMHEIAHKFGISMVCKRCDSAFLGTNNGQETNPSVACQCRELRYMP